MLRADLWLTMLRLVIEGPSHIERRINTDGALLAIAIVSRNPVITLALYCLHKALLHDAVAEICTLRC